MRYEDGIAGTAAGESLAEPSLPDEGPAISVRNLGKRYRVYQNAGQKLKEIVSCGLWRCHNEFWALHDVSFDLAKGETLGIVGRNGSGKSTLLQIICGIVAPTLGTVRTWGKIAGLLELGAGFHPEFTGRENVYMYGAVLGLTREEVNERFHSIVDFSELSAFIDQPVKTYSSGMFVRLAFSTAINVDPDILVVDEALAVGDTLFQAKCFKKFKDIQASGKTVLFVTHSDDLLTRLCSTGMVLDGGRIRFQGPVNDVLNVYRDVLWGPKREQSPVSDAPARAHVRPSVRAMPAADCSESGGDLLMDFLHNSQTDDNFPNRKSYNPNEYRYGDYRAQLVDYLLVSDGRYDVVGCSASDRLDVYVKAYIWEDLDNVILGLTVQTLEGIYVYNNNTRELFVDVPAQRKGAFLITKFSFVPRLVSGNYPISLGIAHQDETGAHWGVDRRYNVIMLEISNNCGAVGIADLDMTITIGM